jgi:hypothetical protein
MLGTEEFSESPCGDLPNISYNFTELLDSLDFHGLNISEFTDQGSPVDKNTKFRQNYVGTLREVLEQWCAAMSLDFYWDNESQKITFIDLEQGADITPAQDIVDPTTAIGREFGTDWDATSVIVSYKESSTLQNTLVQRVITSNTKPYQKREKSKDVQRYVPMLPLHPLDFNAPNESLTHYHTVFGESFTEQRYANIIPWTNQLKRWQLPNGLKNGWAEPNIPDWHEARKRIWYTNRQLWDIDYSMTLSRYNKSLRDIYVGQRIVETCKSTRMGYVYHTSGPHMGQIKGLGGIPYDPETLRDYQANAAALGFEIVGEIHDPQVKTDLVAFFMNGDSDDVQDMNLDQRYYKMFIGYYTPEEHEDIVSWEQKSAEQMYKNAAVVQGTLPGYPFVPPEFYGYKDANKGFEKLKGLSIPKLEHSFSPDARMWPQCPTCLEALEAPYNDILIRSGNFLPTGLYLSQIDNPWGTDVDYFEREFSKTFRDNACDKYNNSLNLYEELEGMYEYKTQTWDLEAFTPKFFDNLNDAWEDLAPEWELLAKHGALIDEVSVAGVDINTKFRRTCKKMHLMVVTNVATHPNIYFHVGSAGPVVNPKAREQRFVYERSEAIRKAKEEYITKCDRDISFEFCENAIKSDGRKAVDYGIDFDEQMLNQCAISPTGVYKEGFDKEIIGGYPVPEFCDGTDANGQKCHDRTSCEDPNKCNSNWIETTANGLNPIWEGWVNSRTLNINLIRNPSVSALYPDTDDMGFYYLADLEEDLDVLPETAFNFNIIYPVNNYRMYGIYNGQGGTVIGHDAVAGSFPPGSNLGAFPNNSFFETEMVPYGTQRPYLPGYCNPFYTAVNSSVCESMGGKWIKNVMGFSPFQQNLTPNLFPLNDVGQKMGFQNTTLFPGGLGNTDVGVCSDGTAWPLSSRTTCNNESCSDGAYTTKIDCEGAGEEWTHTDLVWTPTPGSFQCYSGIWNAKVGIEDRIPELTEIYGEPIAKPDQNGKWSNPTTSIKVINNNIDPDLEAGLNPDTNSFITKIFDQGGTQLTTVKQWHDFVAGYSDPNTNAYKKGLDDHSVLEPTKQISLRIAGSVREFPEFHKGDGKISYAHPYYGLTNYTISLTEAGLQTDLSYASRPPQAPELESILNKIGPRTV